MAIVMLGRTDDPASRDFLRQLYASTSSVETKSHIVHAMSMSKLPEDRRWLIDRALDANESAEVREQALIIVGQQEDVPVADIIAIYDGVKDPEMRQRMVFVLSMRSEPAATDKLMALARNDPDPEIRQQAILMLGRSKDPRVAQFLMELIKK